MLAASASAAPPQPRVRAVRRGGGAVEDLDRLGEAVVAREGVAEHERGGQRARGRSSRPRSRPSMCARASGSPALSSATPSSSRAPSARLARGRLRERAAQVDRRELGRARARGRARPRRRAARRPRRRPPARSAAGARRRAPSGACAVGKQRRRRAVRACPLRGADVGVDPGAHDRVDEAQRAARREDLGRRERVGGAAPPRRRPAPRAPPRASARPARGSRAPARAARRTAAAARAGSRIQRAAQRAPSASIRAAASSRRCDPVVLERDHQLADEERVAARRVVAGADEAALGLARQALGDQPARRPPRSAAPA